jgi:hypothetical protein
LRFEARNDGEVKMGGPKCLSDWRTKVAAGLVQLNITSTIATCEGTSTYADDGYLFDRGHGGQID